MHTQPTAEQLKNLLWWMLWRDWLWDTQCEMQRAGQFEVCFRPRPQWLRGF